jgi:hypothetical protein
VIVVQFEYWVPRAWRAVSFVSFAGINVVARRENAREDLFAESTALVERAEMRTKPKRSVIGFRAGGAASFYWCGVLAYHFDSANRLRRAYDGHLLYKADRGRLASLERRRTADEVQLIRHDLDDAEMARFLDQLAMILGDLKMALSAGAVKWLREIPEGGAVRARIAEWVAGLPERIEVAQSARVG